MFSDGVRWPLWKDHSTPRSHKPRVENLWYRAWCLNLGRTAHTKSTSTGNSLRSPLVATEKKTNPLVKFLGHKQRDWHLASGFWTTLHFHLRGPAQQLSAGWRIWNGRSLHWLPSHSCDQTASQQQLEGRQTDSGSRPQVTWQGRPGDRSTWRVLFIPWLTITHRANQRLALTSRAPPPGTFFSMWASLTPSGFCSLPVWCHRFENQCPNTFYIQATMDEPGSKSQVSVRIVPNKKILAQDPWANQPMLSKTEIIDTSVVFGLYFHLSLSVQRSVSHLYIAVLIL